MKSILEELKKENLRKVEKLAQMQTGMLLWHLVFNNPDFGLFVCEFDRERSEFMRVSRSVKKLLGYDCSEMEGKKFYDFLHEEDIQATFDIVTNQLMENKEAIGFSNRYRRKNGTYVKATWYSSGGEDNRQIAFAVINNKN
jgi:PAS domain S-box-containing protein